MIMIYYISEQKLYTFNGTSTQEIPCQAIEQYKKNLKEIHQRKEWKSRGTGASFMGLTQDYEVNLEGIFPTDMVVLDGQKVIYSANLQGGNAIQNKAIDDLSQAEGLVLRNTEYQVYDMAYDKHRHRLALSVDGQGHLERYLSILPIDGNRIQTITEGECRDSNPCFDPKHADILYYDSCGLAYTHDDIVESPRVINRLNLSTGDLETILTDDKYDFFKPYIDQNGNLYVIRRPYQGRNLASSPMTTFKDIIFAPVKLLKAMFGWLDFFTQRYSGETLKTSGANPAKVKQQSEEERFIEGNLLKVHQNRQKSQQDGDKFIGVIPKSWELVKYTPSGEMSILKKGVMAFAIDGENIIYSNGQYIIKQQADSSEQMLVEAKWVSKIRIPSL
ncbi:hypothetical protein L3D26_06795 [Moraxella sp. ZY21109]|nr:hypothetical protein [Moraxella sp. ZY210820]WLF85094.1 hypothetical protein LU301_07100 [Moraxella sp. ZY210820]